MTRAPRRRARLAIVVVLLVPVGLAARLLPGTAGDVAGGLLYAAMLVVLCALVTPRARSVTLGAVAAALGVGIELLQLTGLPAALAETIPAARYVLGSTFVAADLVVAVVGAALAAAADSLVPRLRARTHPHAPDAAQSAPRQRQG